MAQRFPSRNYPYGAGDSNAEAAGEAEPVLLEAATIHRFVLGLDARARPLQPEELDGLGDPFARALLAAGTFPLSLRSLLELLDGFAEAGCPFVPATGVSCGRRRPHSWTPETDALARGSGSSPRGRHDDFRVLISASTVADGEEDRHFLQVIGWDATNGVFNYYERRGGTWLWAGNSLHALAPATRGRGPFDSHVNGSLVMKELRQPWVYWHAPAAGIGAEALAPADPLRSDPLFVARETADRLETTVVRPGIQRWNRARLARARQPNGRLNDLPAFSGKSS